MNKTVLEFDKAPPLLPTFYQALLLPRKGVKNRDAFPSIEGRLQKVKVDQDNLKRYRALCELDESSHLPILYPHVLAGVLHLHILTHPKFPVKLLGAVHKYNTVTANRPLGVDEVYDVHAQLEQPRYYAKGLEFDLVTKVSAAGAVVWTEVSTYFVRKNFSGAPESEATPYVAPAECTDPVARWKLHSMAGKKYALICKDFNPIHIAAPLAKLFGFKKDLVHDMCSAAQALGKIPHLELTGKAVKIYFKGPSYMGSNLELRQSTEISGRYDLFCGNNDRPVISFGIE